MKSAKAFVGRATFTYSMYNNPGIPVYYAAHWVWGQYRFWEPHKIRFSDMEFAFDGPDPDSDEENRDWEAVLLQRACLYLYDLEEMVLGNRYDISIEVFGEAKRLATLGVRGLLLTEEVLAHPIEPDALPPAVVKFGNLVHLLSASPEEIFDSALAEIVDAMYSKPPRKIDPEAEAVFEKYGIEIQIFGESDDAYAVVSDIPDFDQEWAQSLGWDENMFLEELYSEYPERLEQLEKGEVHYSDEELAGIKKAWWESVENSENQHEAISVYTVTKHEVGRRTVYSVWNPSGYSFDNFDISYCGIFRTAKEAQDYISSGGELI